MPDVEFTRKRSSGPSARSWSSREHASDVAEPPTRIRPRRRRVNPQLRLRLHGRDRRVGASDARRACSAVTKPVGAASCRAGARSRAHRHGHRCRRRSCRRARTPSRTTWTAGPSGTIDPDARTAREPEPTNSAASARRAVVVLRPRHAARGGDVRVARAAASADHCSTSPATVGRPRHPPRGTRAHPPRKRFRATRVRPSPVLAAAGARTSPAAPAVPPTPITSTAIRPHQSSRVDVERVVERPFAGAEARRSRSRPRRGSSRTPTLRRAGR